MTKHLKKGCSLKSEGSCGASSVCKTEAHAYVWLSQEESGAVFKRDVIVSGGFMETRIKGATRKTVNNVYSSWEDAKEQGSWVFNQSWFLLIFHGSAP